MCSNLVGIEHVDAFESAIAGHMMDEESEPLLLLLLLLLLLPPLLRAEPPPLFTPWEER